MLPVRSAPRAASSSIAEIGDPLAIAAEVPVSQEALRPGPSSISLFARLEPMTYVWVVCLVIAVGTSLYFIGWALGMLMIWPSSLWTRRVKIWATALLPACFLCGLPLVRLRLRRGICRTGRDRSAVALHFRSYEGTQSIEAGGAANTALGFCRFVGPSPRVTDSALKSRTASS